MAQKAWIINATGAGNGSSPWLYRAGFLALLVFVFTVPWEDLTLIAGADTISKLVGLAAGVIALFGVLEARRARGHPFLWFSLLFVAWSGATYFWSIAPAATLGKDTTILELWAAAWLIYQYADSNRAICALLAAYALGSVVTSVGLLSAFYSGALLKYSGYSIGQFNPNVLAYYVALAATISWYLARKTGRILLRTVFWAVTGLSVVAVMLTASRGGTIILGIGLMYAVVSLRNMRAWVKVLALAGLVAAVWVAFSITPAHILGRLMTITSELQGSTLDHRTTIWQAGLTVLAEHPILGTGAFTFPLTITHIVGIQYAAHNVFVQVLVETGVIGFALWGMTLMSASAWIVRGSGSPDRLFWLTIIVQLGLALMTANFEWRKMVWLMLALLAAAGVQYRNTAEECIHRGIAEPYRSSGV